MVYQINGETVTLIWVDDLPVEFDRYQWELYKALVLGIWPGEADEAEKGKQPEAEAHHDN